MSQRFWRICRDIMLEKPNLSRRENIPSSEFELNQVDVDLFGTPLERGCRHQPQCPPSSPKYRSQDGICNNPVHSTWGATGSPMSRLLPPSYEDGIWEPRTYAVDGGRLPNARTASRELLDDVDRPHATYNLLMMQFGQFLTHDVSQSSSITTGKEYRSEISEFTIWFIVIQLKVNRFLAARKTDRPYCHPIVSTIRACQSKSRATILSLDTTTSVAST